MTQEEEQREKESIHSFNVVQIQYSKYHSSYYVWFLRGLKATTTDLQVEGGCCAKTVSSEADTPSPPEGFRRLSVSRQAYVCFYNVLPREEFSSTSGAGSLLATNASEREAGREGEKKPAITNYPPLIDFLATLWRLTLVMGNAGNDSLSSPADK